MKPDVQGTPGAVVEGAIEEFGRVLAELHDAHAELTARAARMEHELEAKVAELEAILHDLPTGIVMRDAGGAVQRVNPVAQALLGESEQELRGRTNLTLLDQLLADGTSYALSVDGEDPRSVALRRSPVALPDGTCAGTVEILDDRTEIEAMTLRVNQQAKMVALGTMAGGIAHEIRNPLNAVRGFASLLAEKVDDGTTEQRWARLIEEGVDECDAIVGAIMAFAAPERLVIERLDVSELCESALHTVRRELARTGDEERFELESEITPGLCIDGDRIQLRQALRNLIANAIEVQPDGGVVRLEASVREDPFIEFRVHDAGPGVPPALVGSIADPFFTTRAEGTGLGLALVHTVARLHGGSLDVSPTTGPLGGADLQLVIPTVSALARSAASPQPIPAPAPAPSDAR